MSDPSLTVLVVDDDELTAELVIRALRKVDGKFNIVPACDGQEALDMLRGLEAVRVEKPYVVLLDLNMPRLNGFEFLEQLRGDKDLRDSIVFVLTTSDADSDRSRAYHECIAGYMVKSAIGPQFCRLASMLSQYSQTVVLPE